MTVATNVFHLRCPACGWCGRIPIIEGEPDSERDARAKAEHASGERWGCPTPVPDEELNTL